MNKHQEAAFEHPCRLGIEVFHPRFSYMAPHGAYSIGLTLNYGFE